MLDRPELDIAPPVCRRTRIPLIVEDQPMRKVPDIAFHLSAIAAREVGFGVPQAALGPSRIR
jgi:hypothetical protein